MMRIEVAYLGKESQKVVGIEIPLKSTVRQGIEASNILSFFPELNENISVDHNIEFLNVRVGIFGQMVTLDHILSAGDRIEIYRPLVKDPKLLRKERAKRFRLQKLANKRMKG